MLSRTVTTRVVFALLLTMFMGWVGHASALLMPANQQTVISDGHPHSHDEPEIIACQACSDHFHAPFTADHVHETPHLNALLDLASLPDRRILDVPQISVRPTGPVFLIERPPRSRFVL
ncbi:hypothetical protein I5M24_31310 [Pseudomonas aeruginosa]|uniref:Uncharacterized protein n=2 Tax=Ectopseudomonas oleovorans TaxID=301 RepID=A0A2T5PSX0_ECTOL|nr:hypothetical protein [Pseudomonas aeruginosa]PTU80834.1 hypothetical protein DBO86_01335 [Pseudomonas indoloxydans]RRV25463.1 hypothetical protein EGJ23_15835 [Pseudomonas sp. o96-267]MBH3890070.1 hypothetical protein [Pseudomonas aeruginosa]MBI8491062.1 hypothetical protein [Pseudomonas aeruginosa]